MRTQQLVTLGLSSEGEVWREAWVLSWSIGKVHTLQLVSLGESGIALNQGT